MNWFFVGYVIFFNTYQLRPEHPVAAQKKSGLKSLDVI